MHQQEQPAENDYPIGRGYGHDYMRGGEVFGGYGYSERPEYARRRGESRAETDAEDSGQRRRSSDGAEDDTAG